MQKLGFLRHPFHILTSSPWPFVTALQIFLFLFGFIFMFFVCGFIFFDLFFITSNTLEVSTNPTIIETAESAVAEITKSAIVETQKCSQPVKITNSESFSDSWGELLDSSLKSKHSTGAALPAPNAALLALELDTIKLTNLETSTTELSCKNKLFDYSVRLLNEAQNSGLSVIDRRINEFTANIVKNVALDTRVAEEVAKVSEPAVEKVLVNFHAELRKHKEELIIIASVDDANVNANVVVPNANANVAVVANVSAVETFDGAVNNVREARESYATAFKALTAANIVAGVANNAVRIAVVDANAADAVVNAANIAFTGLNAIAEKAESDAAAAMSDPTVNEAAFDVIIDAATAAINTANAAATAIDNANEAATSKADIARAALDVAATALEVFNAAAADASQARVVCKDALDVAAAAAAVVNENANVALNAALNANAADVSDASNAAKDAIHKAAIVNTKHAEMLESKTGVIDESAKCAIKKNLSDNYTREAIINIKNGTCGIL